MLIFPWLVILFCFLFVCLFVFVCQWESWEPTFDILSHRKHLFFLLWVSIKYNYSTLCLTPAGLQLILRISRLALILLPWSNQPADWYCTGPEEKWTFREAPSLTALFSAHDFLCLLFHIRIEKGFLKLLLPSRSNPAAQCKLNYMKMLVILVRNDLLYIYNICYNNFPVVKTKLTFWLKIYLNMEIKKKTTLVYIICFP